MNLKSLLLLLSICLSLICSFANAQATPPANAQSVMSDSAFAAALKLDGIRSLSLQDRQTIKTWDTFARQTVSQIAGRSRINDRDPLFTLLDIAFVPEKYLDQPILRIKNPQLLSDLLAMPGLDPAMRSSIEATKAVSLGFWVSEPVQQFATQMQQQVIASRDSINQIQTSAQVLTQLSQMRAPLDGLHFVPPAQGADWHRLPELQANMALAMIDDPQLKQHALPGYDNLRIARITSAITQLSSAWRNRDAAAVQTQIDMLARELPTLTSSYPSAARRETEILYNKAYKLTLPGAFIYFAAFVLFIISAYSKRQGIRRWAIGCTVLGLALHTLGIAIRWWLDQSSTGSWFYSIPIKNQFESVMMSAWFGMVVGLILELCWKRKGLFGAAASFVGWMSLVALFTVPYIFHKDIGNEIGRSTGILMSYWLYVHVTLATASYALIGMSFLLGVWWIARYFSAPPEVRAMGPNRLSSDAARGEPEPQRESLAMAFSPVPALAGATDVGGGGDFGRSRVPDYATGVTRAYTSSSAVEPIRALLAHLDACNVVILQLAFWILGVAIVCGAIWADVSWGRPWGWDPKETFALVTWIVYLIILHVRLVTKQKALWTAILCIVGFFVMLFNWIGVNYFLVGLHSYA